MNQNGSYGPLDCSAGMPQATVVMQGVPNQNDGVNHALATRTARVLGICHIVCGIVMIVFQIAATSIVVESNGSSTSVAGTGIWCGVFILINGILGCYSASHKTNGIIISFLVFSVLCGFLFSPIMLGVTGGDIANRDYSFCRWDWRSKISICSGKEVMVSMNAIMLLAAFLEFVLCMWSIGVTSVAIQKTNGCACCCSCCYDKPPTGPVIVYMPSNGQGGQIPSGNQLVYSFPNSGVSSSPQVASFVQIQQGVSLPQMQQGFPATQMQYGVATPQGMAPPGYPGSQGACAAQPPLASQLPLATQPPPYKM